MNLRGRLRNPDFWKSHYVVESDPADIAVNLKTTTFVSGGAVFDLVQFGADHAAPNVLISQGSGGHAFVFAELAYQIHRRGYNVFIMPKHGGYSISELMVRHRDALKWIASNFHGKIGVYSEGLGGFVVFYLTLAHAPIGSAIYQNSPALLTEQKFHESVIEGGKKILFAMAKFLHKVAPRLKLPISSYLNWKRLVDSDPANKKIETRLVADGYLKDADFDKWYPLSAILSLLTTPPPRPLSELEIPTLLMIAARGFGGHKYAQYLRDLYDRLPSKRKRIIEVDGSVYWMLSHPKTAAAQICDWFDKTL